MLADLKLPPIESLGAPGARAFVAQFNATRPAGRPVGEVVDGTLDGADGPLAYRLYRPATPGPHPIVVYFHGGGWVLGDAQSDDPFCRDLCRRSGMIVRQRRLQARAGASLPGGGRGRPCGAALGGRPRGRAGWPAGAAAGRGLERRRQHRCRDLPAGARPRRAGDRRPAAGLPGHRRHVRPAFVQRERDGLFPDALADVLVLGPLLRAGRPQRSARFALARQSSRACRRRSS